MLKLNYTFRILYDHTKQGVNMKHIIASMLLTITLLSTATSYAWVCTFVGPQGAVYSRDGGGYGRDAAYNNALNACRVHKVHNGVPCAFQGCVRS